MEKTDFFKEIEESSDKNYLINLFFDIMNDSVGYIMKSDVIDESLFKPLNKLDVCVHIVNRINSLSINLSEEEKIELFDINLFLRNLYVLCLDQIERIKEDLINKKHYDRDMVDYVMKSNFGLISKKVNQDKQTKDYVSREMIKDYVNDIFPDKDIEKEIHKKYKTKEEIEKNGIRKTIIDILYKFDPEFGDYIAVNPSILNEVQSNIEGYLKDFDSYQVEEKDKKVIPFKKGI